MIKQFLRWVLKSFGIIAFKRSSGVFIPEGESYQIVSALVGRFDPVVIDGGAHRGDMAETLGILLPSAEFYCFEPDPLLGDVLQHKFASNPRVHVVQAALGNVAGKAKFNINVSRPTNSLLPSSESLQSDIKQLCKTVEQVDVDVISIDEYCRLHSIDRVDVVKLDLQGYDYFALQGGRSILGGVKVVLVEVIFSKIYQGAGSFQDILELMRESGFNLYTLCGLQYGDDAKLLWADAIFIRSA